MREELHFAPGAENIFVKEKSLSYWLNSDIGEIVAQDSKGRDLRRLTVDEGVFFLKRGRPESLSRHARMLLFGKRPVCSALREVLMLETLKKNGFSSMEPVAWGQQVSGKFRARGFLLVRNVEGQDFADLFNASTGGTRGALMKKAGMLVGQLHAAGLLQPVRLKDLIYTDRGLVLIDRETSKPWRSVFSRRQAVASLARTVRRTVREEYRVGAGSAVAFLRGYQKGIASRWTVALPALTTAVLTAVRRELRAGNR